MMTCQEYKTTRLNFGITQAELAEKLGVTRQTINSRETDVRQITRQAEIALAGLERHRRIYRLETELERKRGEHA